MSKSFMLKRHTSPESMISPRTPETRTKSLPRDTTSLYGSHYHRSEFGLDGSLSRCPVHDSPRTVTTSPRLSRDPSYHQLTSKMYFKRLNTIQNWNTIYTSKVPGYQMMETDIGGPSCLKTTSKLSGTCKHKDLKRKMVFDLHKEVKKGVNTTVLEEISDMDRITDICMTTLKSMMDSKKHRKYLHHMNNNALPREISFGQRSGWYLDDLTNNAELAKSSLRRKDSLLGVGSNVNTVLTYFIYAFPPPLLTQVPVYSRRAAKRPTENVGTVSVLDSSKTRGPRMSYITIPGMGRILRSDVMLPESTATTSSTALKPAGTSKQARTKTDERPDRKQISVGAADAGAAPDDAKDDMKALKLMAEIQAQYFKQHDDESGQSQKPKQDAKKFIPLLTPEEALACKWLRLTPQQVQALEDLIRAKGMDPGIHEHSILKDYDVFAEIRQLRQAAQKQASKEIIEEAEEGEKN
ncbi:uncharacterized protein LOC106069276 isoform X3 [Biomphalaria glabrata]|uniref:Uncharacterized protein LOC106069276 isoform X3 n=1 Tax=Biomphalaria glabrata TaxID=6526 RepID=A0A9W3AXS3_BIOGL|nr:uncharacterized protein LOC106069276 isoform X3 [Biomphalaria glabrata]